MQKKVVKVVREIPLDKILVETDCPYMAPVPNRGKRNRSEYIEYIVEKIADIKSILPINVKEQTASNVRKLLNV
ncbi:Tat protein secretion system quality control protein TatD with DNase activity [Clostridium acetobutylicum]|nr:Tat protein secretion system quality control protein TatD with DNase activity [Clostridium acetobutylicum]